MRFVSLSLLSTGAALRSGLIGLSDLEPAKLRACREVLSVDSTTSSLAVPGWEDLVIRQTLSEGMGLLTVWRAGVVASSVILLAGTDPAAEAALLAAFHESNAKMYAKLLAGQTTTDDAPYVDFYVEDRRPAVFQVMWPGVDLADHGRVEPLAAYFGAAFFEALGVERDAGDA